MKIGIFGGSFNPIHNMHLKIANYLIENKYLDKIIFVPTGDKYSYKTHMLEADKRLIMINLAIKDNPNILSSDYEIKNQMVYTYETLNYFKELYHNDKIYFVCGMDNLDYLDKWQKPEEILKFPIIVVNRNKEKMNSKFLKYKNIKQVKIKLSSLSSTLIRKKIKDNKSIKDLVPKDVEKYITINNLYRRDLNMYKEIVEKLKAKKLTIATMESCTGGEIASQITNIEGASEVILFSAVTYSNEFKIKMGVSKDIIDKYSVYSIETAREMAKNIKEFSHSDIGIGITGKLARADKNNNYGKDNQVFINILYHDKSYDYTLNVSGKNRVTSKNEVATFLSNKLNNILS